jgi:tRNA threonylcarbamoyladenosine biosynthesis protein TsaB
MLLALDTSTSLASVALVHTRRVVAELTWEVGQRHSTDLLQRLHWLLDIHGVAARELTAVAVATGPGSFNGVRVALTTAKSLAFASGIPLYGHPTLDVIAWGSADADGPLYAVLEAGRGQLYCAYYSAPAASAAGWGPRDGYHIQTPAELAEVAACSRERVLFCGEWREETQARLMEALAERARFRSQVAPRRASWLAELALARIESGAPADDPVQLEPLYLRRPAITTSTKTALRRADVASAGSTPAERSGEGASRALHS